MNTLQFLIDQTIKGSAILAVAWALAAIFARRSASRARLIWACAFCTLFALPFAPLLPLRWEYGPHEETAPEEFLPAPAPEVDAVRLVAPNAAEEPAPAQALAALPAAPRPFPWPNPATCALSLWAAGAALLLLRRLVAGLRLARLHRSLATIDDPRLLTLAREIVGDDSGMLRISPHVTVPMTWGIRQPVIVLPTTAADWTEPELRAALLHEWAHVAGRDCLLRLLTTLGCALHWPNPLAWLAARAFRTAQEQTCDDFALSSGADAESYARQLISAARAIRDCPLGALAMAQPSTLGRRVRAVCDPARDRRRPGWRTHGLAVLVATGLLGALALAAPREKKPALPQIQPAPGAPVEIRAQYIELDAAQLRTLFPKMKEPGLLAIQPEAEQAALLARIREMHGDHPLDQGILFEPELKPSAKGADLLSAPRVTTKSGNRAVIEIIREVRYEIEDGTFETTNIGITLEVEPTLTSRGINFAFHPQFVELKPEAAGRKISRDSFHRIGWENPKLELPRGQSVAVGGWETIHKGRQLLVLVSARSPFDDLLKRAEATQLPALNFDHTPLAEITARLTELTKSAKPPKIPDPAFGIQMNAGQPEPRVTVNLPAGSLAEALRRIARAARLAMVATSEGHYGGAYFVFAEPPPKGVSARAAAILLPRVKRVGRSLSVTLNEIVEMGAQADILAFRPTLSLDSLPVDVLDRAISIDANQVTLRDALQLAASAAGLELSADATTFYLRAPGKRPAGAKPIAPASGATARPATKAEVAAQTIMLDIRHADVTPEQLSAPAVLDEDARAYVTRRAGFEPGVHLFTIGGMDPAKLAAAGIAVDAVPRITTQQHQRVSVQISGAAPADGDKNPNELGIEATIGPDGASVDMNIDTPRKAAKEGQPARRIQTNVTVFSGSTVVLSEPLSGKEGKIRLIFITATLP